MIDNPSKYPSHTKATQERLLGHKVFDFCCCLYNSKTLLRICIYANKPATTTTTTKPANTKNNAKSLDSTKKEKQHTFVTNCLVQLFRRNSLRKFFMYAPKFSGTATIVTEAEQIICNFRCVDAVCFMLVVQILEGITEGITGAQQPLGGTVEELHCFLLVTVANTKTKLS